MNADAHDLLEAVRGDAVVADVAIPDWVVQRLTHSRFVVVRRAARREGYLPIGVRGNERGERFAAWLAPQHVATRITPESLGDWRALPVTAPGSARLPHFAVLDRVAVVMRAHELAWGPVGSIGYELASGFAAVTHASDIDVIVRATSELPRACARLLVAELGELPIRIDVQIEFPFGAVALAEYAARDRVLLRTADGPRLVDDPWRIEAGEHS